MLKFFRSHNKRSDSSDLESRININENKHTLFYIVGKPRNTIINSSRGWEAVEK